MGVDYSFEQAAKERSFRPRLYSQANTLLRGLISAMRRHAVSDSAVLTPVGLTFLPISLEIRPDFQNGCFISIETFQVSRRDKV